MTDIQTETRRVFHSPADLITLVSDVRDYPAFINWIQKMQVLEDQMQNGSGTLIARALVGYKFVREKFTTRVEANRDAGTISVSFVDGPFSILDNKWQFHGLADGSTLVEFWIRYRFKNPILQKLVEANVGRAASTLINAFESRARERFAPAGDPARETSELMTLHQAALKQS
jgi:coenzyme Q-binding protein COQ10